MCLLWPSLTPAIRAKNGVADGEITEKFPPVRRGDMRVQHS